MDKPLELAQAAPDAPAAPQAPGGGAVPPAGGTVQTAPATPPGRPPAGDPGFGPLLLMTGMMVAIFWFLVWKPQRKREQERTSMIEKLRKNDRILTTGGLYGTVHSVRDNVVVIKVDEDSDVKLRVAKTAITLVESGAEGAGEVKK